MINLSPDDYKESLRYARRSSKLLRWVGGTLYYSDGCLLTQLIGFTYLKSETKHTKKSMPVSRKIKKIMTLRVRYQDCREYFRSLKLIVQVLSKQVLFFSGINQTGGLVMPENTVLSNIEISKVEGGIDLSAETKRPRISHTNPG